MKILLGTPIRASPRPWLEFLGILDVPVMVSAYELVKVRPMNRDSPLHTMLQHSGEIWVDSGGYQFLSRGVLIEVDEVARVYSEFWDASTYLSIDYPPSPTDDPHDAEAKFRRSLANYVKLGKLMEREGIEVTPIIHYYRDEGIVNRYLKAIIDLNPHMIAIGGLVPYILVVRNVPKGSRFRALSFIQRVVNEYGGIVHVLGLGSPSITPILELLGVHSTDTSTWRVKAAYGKVLLPGGGERHVTGREVNFGKRIIDDEEVKYLGDFLRETKFPYLDKYPEYMRTSFEYRALINAWVVLLSRGEPRAGVFKKIYRSIRMQGLKALVSTPSGSA